MKTQETSERIVLNQFCDEDFTVIRIKKEDNQDKPRITIMQRDILGGEKIEFVTLSLKDAKKLADIINKL